MTPGEIQHRQRAQQLIDFSNMRWNTITPTDIDGFLDFYGKHFVYLEYKLVGKDLPRGQELALEHAAQSHVKAGKDVIVIVCEHNTPIEQDILADLATVVRFYYENEWHQTKHHRTAKELIDLFLERCRQQQNNRNQPF